MAAAQGTGIKGRRFLICMVLLLLSFLLLGAVRINSSVVTARNSRAAEKQAWSRLLERTASEIPAENSMSYRESSSADPYFYLLANTVDLRIPEQLADVR